MKNSNTKNASHWWILAAIFAGVALLNSATGSSQESKSETPAAAKEADAPAKDAKAEPAAKDAEKNTTPAKDQTPAKSTAPADQPPAKSNEPAKTAPAPPGETGPAVQAAPPDEKAPRSTAAPSSSEKAPSKDASLPAGKTEPSVASKALDQAGVSDQARIRLSPWLLGLILLALFVLPVLAGNYLARIWKMPDHGWKMSLMIGTIAASILICVFSKPKYGPDLAGGSTLIYELAEAPTTVATEDPQQPRKGAGESQIKSGAREFKLSELTSALKKRIDPDGILEITIREYGPAVEIIIPHVGQDELDYVKEKLTKMGQLEFRITADPTLTTSTRDQEAIALAKQVPPNQKDVFKGDTKVAEWVPYDVKKFESFDNLVRRTAGDTPEALVLMDPFNVTGEYLTRASQGADEMGKPAVHFTFNAQGSSRFEKLTGQNRPNPATGNVHRHLGIILDKKLDSAPHIRQTISTHGMINGELMSDKEVKLLVETLNAGSLPAALNKTPISEDQVSPTLGGLTVEYGKRAITASLIGVVIFMIVYYRFSGVVASIGLALNLLMVVAVMILIGAAFTLPGIAGLALTVGMSVDTNVLIYERIREELAGGAALRMAIRNGFGRAMSAIIDTHLTTIISGVVLFSVGTDQVKGFAITLILGLVVNLFTAFFCTRVAFDVAERRGWIKELKMMHMFREPNFDFLSLRWVALGFSWLLIIIGMVAVYFRGSQLLDIDFTGGSSVAFTLNERVERGEVTDQLRKAKLGEQTLNEKNLLVTERGKTGTEYTVDTSEPSVDNIKQVIRNEFGDKLKKYTFEYRDLKTISEGNSSGVEAKLLINAGAGDKTESGVAHDALRDQIATALAQAGHKGIQPTLTNPEYRRGSNARFNEWTMRVAGLDEQAARAVLESLQQQVRDTPIFPLASQIGGRVSGDMQLKAFQAIVVSLIAMILYLWLRFSKPSYGIAAGVALVHDVLFTIGMLALSHYIVQAMPGVARVLQIESFQINLTIVAALLTIIGFSVNDTIVTFDRLREIKGKSPNLTAKMVNDAVNQTLSRTILTVFTVLIVVVIMYFFGGEGLHSFAFTFLMGIITGTYSSVYIAAPVVLWLSGVSAAPVKEVPRDVRGMQPAR